MARRPLLPPVAQDDAPAPDAAGAGADVGAGGGAPPDVDQGADAGETVLVTICKAPDGSYVVYSGDEPEEMEAGGAGMSEADVEAGDDAMPPAAPGAGDAEVGAEGQPCDTIGAALKAALDILQGDAESEGEPGSGEDQFQSGFGGGMAPTTTIPQKY